ncbi:MAG TPA: sulfopyruvate decarboxylase subunit alpha [Methanospirillum sp.]|nr:sulfopyruvate decarboxylase subunit alpha [Methanospirillum sp.]
MYEAEVSGLLKTLGVEFIVSLPCDRTKGLCSILEDKFRYITVPREEDGVGICSGLSLAGRKSVLQMQSSGIGNSLNALMTLPYLYGLSLPIIASWRGYYQEKIPAQIPFNEKIPQLLALYDIPCTIISEPDDLAKISSAFSDAWDNRRPHVILISPRVWEGEEPQVSCIPLLRERTVELSYSRLISRPVMQRADAIRILTNLFTDELVVSNIGVPSKELYAAGDRALNFYMYGSYTQASSIGLGLDLGSTRRTTVIDGDGSLLGTAVLPVAGEFGSSRLTIIGLDNGVFGSTGNQCTPAHAQVDLELLARAAGIKDTCKVHSAQELGEAYTRPQNLGPRFIHVIIRPGNTAAPNIPLTPTTIRDRFAASVSDSRNRY